MTWSFDDTLSTTRDITRLTIGDINTSDQLLSNEIVAYYLALYSDDTTQAAIACVKAILAKLARDVDRSTTGPTTTRSQKTTHYRDLLKDLQAQAYGAVECFVGGVSVTIGDANAADSDFSQPAFKMGRDDHD